MWPFHPLKHSSTLAFDSSPFLALATISCVPASHLSDSVSRLSSRSPSPVMETKEEDFFCYRYHFCLFRVRLTLQYFFLVYPPALADNTNRGAAKRVDCVVAGDVARVAHSPRFASVATIDRAQVHILR